MNVSQGDLKKYFETLTLHHRRLHDFLQELKIVIVFCGDIVESLLDFPSLLKYYESLRDL